VFFGSIVAATIAAAIVYFYTHVKWDFRVEGYGWKESLKTIHLNDLWMQFYDTELHPKVDYARHAISIDENRENFKRVGWSSPRGTGKDAHGIQWFEQVWFVGNHSDIGGSYPKNQSRLSDIALDRMLRWAVAVPNGLKFDRQVLRTWPYPDGPQHDEVAAGFGSIPRWTGITWAEKYRDLPKGGNSTRAAVV
jgi:T6SS, Phospholipase effector Tle1-like, catalytic domain